MNLEVEDMMYKKVVGITYGNNFGKEMESNENIKLNKSRVDYY